MQFVLLGEDKQHARVCLCLVAILVDGGYAGRGTGESALGRG